MNYKGFDFNESAKALIESCLSTAKLPHSIIIEGGSERERGEAAIYISMLAVCREASRPCGKCPQCLKARAKSHADISYAYPEKKSKTYSIEQMRSIIKDSVIRPNEADAKIYIFEEADSRLSPTVQNAFLKLLEEPPKNVSFLLLCENSKKLLGTILSRCTVLKLKSETSYSETAVENAKKIALGISSPEEWELLTALHCLKDKESAGETLEITKLLLRDCMAVSKGAHALTDGGLANSISQRITASAAMEMMRATDAALEKLTQNVNINLLTAWLCGEYRRILWQR